VPATFSRRTALGLALAAAGSGCARRAPTRVTIVIAGMAFGAAPAGLRVGDSIEWVNRDIFQHTATARDGSFDLVLAPDASGRVVLKKPGRLEVYCRYHPGMTLAFDVAA
jgi:plastocyanin